MPLPSPNLVIFQPLQIFSPEELQLLAQKIVESGELGRSKIYVSLLEYLLKNASCGKAPKEIEIAIDVLGRDSGFDVSRDSVVRVYIHQLRKKLDSYYLKHEQEADYRIVIPRGQYTIAVVACNPVDNLAGLRGKPAYGATFRHSPRVIISILLAGALLLAANLYYLFQNADARLSPAASRQHPWSALLDDDLPVLLVMGDYFIYGELNDLGNVTRMIRDFSVNSSQDLSALFMRDPDMRSKYLDLDLNYMPEGSAVALAKVVPLLQAQGKRVSVTMMSRLNTADLKSNHIVYIGYISALAELQSLVFSASGLTIGRTYDELQNKESGEIYSSDAGLPSYNEPFMDYGFFSTFPSTSQNQFIVIAGTRDAGLMHTAQAITDATSLTSLTQTLNHSQDSNPEAYEALYEVFGFNRLNFDATLVHTQLLDSNRIWGGELSNTPP